MRIGPTLDVIPTEHPGNTWDPKGGASVLPDHHPSKMPGRLAPVSQCLLSKQPRATWRDPGIASTGEMRTLGWSWLIHHASASKSGSPGQSLPSLSSKVKSKKLQSMQAWGGSDFNTHQLSPGKLLSNVSLPPFRKALSKQK